MALARVLLQAKTIRAAYARTHPTPSSEQHERGQAVR